MSKTKSSHFGVHILAIAIFGFLSWNFGANRLFAQDDVSSSADIAPNSAAQAAPDVSDAEVKAVAQDLWCPLCSGVRLDTCELKACEQMRQEIAIQLAEGQSPESIKEYFLAQYGPQVLGEPPREGFNLLAWIVPFVVLVGAAGILLFRSRRLLSQRMVVQTADADWEADWEEEEVTSAPEDDMTDNLPAEARGNQNGESADSYERALDQELRQYEQ